MNGTPTGETLWRGPSRINGEPTVCIMTYRSQNAKTGDMAQCWILGADEHPRDAARSGADGAVCGIGAHRCVHAGRFDPAAGRVVGRSCYVNILKGGPSQIWKSWKDGAYPAASPAVRRARIAGRPIRIGAYGDPCAVPLEVWTDLVARAKGHAGYTSQWRIGANQEYRTILMASCASSADRDDAQALGWRTFRARPADGPVRPGEIVCPATAEGGARLQCAECLACDGAPRPGKVDIVTIAHGPPNLGRAIARNIGD